MKVIRNVEKGKVTWLFHNDGEPFSFSAVYQESQEILTVRYIHPKTKNNYQFDFILGTEEENKEVFEQWFFTIQKNGKIISKPKYMELISILEPTCYIEAILYGISRETLTNFGAPKFRNYWMPKQ